MFVKHFFIVALFFFLQSCAKDDPPSVLLYSNSFDDDTALADYKIGFGTIKIASNESGRDSQGCLNIFNMCLVPNLSTEIGPFDTDYMVHMEAWIKSEYGAAIHLNINSGNRKYVRIETKENLFEARKWNYYTSDDLYVPKGESLMLYFDASNNTLSNTWVDDLKIYGVVKE